MNTAPDSSPQRPGKPRRGGLQRLLSATTHSWHGLRACWRSEAAFRQEVLTAIPLLALALLHPFSALERAMLIAPVLLVLIVELLNSGIEAAIDRIGPQWHELSGMAKDLASAAVSLSLLLLVSVWLLVWLG